MNKNDVIAFFDMCAPNWDDEMIKSDEIINTILNNVQVSKDADVLDVACGTGVMFPYYLSREVASVLGVDISSKMVKIANDKFSSNDKVRVLCADVEELITDKKFDVIVVYNAFPHFSNPENLIKVLASMLKAGGRLTVAHGASRQVIDSHHKGSASKVSVGLMEAEELARIFEKNLTVQTVISNDSMYQVSGIKAD